MDYYNLEINIKAFYSYIGKIEDLDFSNISKEKLDEIYKQSIKLNKYFTTYKSDLKLYKYGKILEWIKTTPKKYNISTKEEIVLLVMFAIDPTLEALTIFEANNKIQIIAREIRTKYGIFDINLIKIEKQYIKNFYSDDQKKDFEDKIIKLAFK